MTNKVKTNMGIFEAVGQTIVSVADTNTHLGRGRGEVTMTFLSGAKLVLGGNGYGQLTANWYPPE